MGTPGPNKGFIKRVVKKLPNDRRKKVEAWAGICMCHASQIVRSSQCYMCVFIVVHHIACYAHVVRCFGVSSDVYACYITTHRQVPNRRIRMRATPSDSARASTPSTSMRLMLMCGSSSGTTGYRLVVTSNVLHVVCLMHHIACA